MSLILILHRYIENSNFKCLIKNCDNNWLNNYYYYLFLKPGSHYTVTKIIKLTGNIIYYYNARLYSCRMNIFLDV